MPFDFAAAKAKCRQAVHNVLGVSAIYKADAVSAPEPIKARWHEKKVLQGQVEGEGAQVWEGVDHVIFNIPQLTELGIKPRRGNIVIFTDYHDFTVVLDYRLPTDGPIEEKWAVTRDARSCQQ